jgi:hypothetical protein
MHACLHDPIDCYILAYLDYLASSQYIVRIERGHLLFSNVTEIVSSCEWRVMSGITVCPRDTDDTVCSSALDVVGSWEWGSQFLVFSMSCL